MTTHEYRFGDFRLYPAARELRRHGRVVTLPRRAFDCLLHLIEHRDRAVGRDELAAATWERTDVSDAQVGQIVLRARRAIGDDGEKQAAIRTLPGYGYRWVTEVEVVTEAQTDATPDAPSPSSPHRRSRVIAALASAAVVAVVALVVAAIVAREGSTPQDDPVAAAPAPAGVFDGAVIVLPVAVEGSADDAWLRLGAMDLIADRLRRAGLSVPASDSLIALLRPLSEETPQQQTALLRVRDDVAAVVEARASASPDGWRVVLSAVDADGTRRHAEATRDDAVPAARAAADLLLAAMGRPLPDDFSERADPDLRLQRARAALLANETDTARALLSELPADDPAARLWLAEIDYRQGRLDEADRSLVAVLDAIDAATQPELAGHALRLRAAIAMRSSDYAEGERRYDAAIAALSQADLPGQLGRALLGRGAARTALYAFDGASEDLGRARLLLEQAGETLGAVGAELNLGVLDLVRLRPAAAQTHSASAADRLLALGAINEALSALNNLTEAQLALLDWSAALATSERAFALRSRVDDPDYLLATTLYRARVLLGLGRHGEVADVLTGIEQRFPDVAAWNRGRLYAALAQWHAALGDHAAAADAGQRATRLWRDEPADELRARVSLRLQRARLALGESVSIPVDEPRVTAAAVAIAEAHAAAGDTDAADAAYRDALALAERRGVPSELALLADSYGHWLLDRDRLDDAAGIVGRVAPWADRDFDCALLRVRLFHARGEFDAWARSLRQARALAGQRAIPPALAQPPSAPVARAASR